MKRLFGNKKNTEKNTEPSRGQADERPVSSFISVLANPLLFMVAGGILIVGATFMLFAGSGGEREADEALRQGQRAVSSVRETVAGFTRLLEDDQVLELAEMAIENPDRRAELEQYLAGRMSEFVDLRIYDPDVLGASLNLSTENAFIITAMLLQAREAGRATVQSFDHSGQQVVAGAVAVPNQSEIRGILVVMADVELVLSGFNSTLPESGYIALEQANGRFSPNRLKAFGDPSRINQNPYRLNVPGTLFRVVLPQSQAPSGIPPWLGLAVFVVGGFLLAFGAIRRFLLTRTVEDLEEDPALLVKGKEAPPQAEKKRTQRKDPLPTSDGSALTETVKSAPARPGVNLADLQFDPDTHRRGHRPQAEKAIVMREEIFRAYDIRGIVGETLDRDVARQIGQAVGSTVLEENAAPVVVGRDGRHSGPDLVQGLIEGIASTGCDVVDIGAVPTGVLYYMANACDSGSGVMVTGSHNPPDYNGFKIMIGGETLAGARIKALFQRLEAGDIASGEGTVLRQDALGSYRDRIASDIQLARPLKVVADCGNGIGGVCAADVLRAIGAEVLPLYDEVDGDFPNHHPDPSEPENLRDLIESVNLMGADLGVAFDGDADRLGVVTPSGEIIFPDRIMMLYAREILSRHPGALIIYDVKCTGHLDRVIREAGGRPEMYKTGHSLIKNHMREAGAPFAGEMSGHFFFGDRWYGFDCGIYSAARLLEILAMDDRSPEEVLCSLPNSISTPELKVHMKEGENHAFIRKFQDQASFPAARVSTIDGIRADFEDGWGLCRASNTTPILVVRFDAESEEALQVIKEAFRIQMLAIDPDLELPF